MLSRSVIDRVRTFARHTQIALAAPERWRRRKALKSSTSSRNQLANESSQLAETGFVPFTVKRQILDALVAEAKPLLDDALTEHASKEHATQISEHQFSKKVFFRELLDQERIRSVPSSLEIALDEDVLQVVASALGMAPYLESVDLLLSLPSEDTLSASQLWHRDVNDKDIIKLFIYLNDVGPDEGPFTYIDKALSDSVPRSLPHYIADSDISIFAPQGQWKTATGKAGTAFLIDTRHCFHCGSRTKTYRLAFIATYSSGLRFFDGRFDWHTLYDEHSRRTLSTLQKCALGSLP